MSEDPSTGMSEHAIRVVARLTGIRSETLRMWERRYGFPSPRRTPGGNRLYSDDDVVRLKLVRQALEFGYRPHEVVARPAAEIEKMLRAFRGEPTVRPVTAGGKPAVAAMIELIAREDAVALRTRLRAAALAMGPAAFVTELVGPLLTEIGEAWSRGELAIRHEHLASQHISTQLRMILTMLEGAERAPVVVLTTLPRELHALGTEMVAVYLAARGCAPRLLGASTPSAELAASAIAQRADAVAVSLSVAVETAPAAKALAELRRALPLSIALWVGGGGASLTQIPEDTAHIEGFAALDSAVDAILATRARGG